MSLLKIELIPPISLLERTLNFEFFKSVPKLQIKLNITYSLVVKFIALLQSQSAMPRELECRDRRVQIFI